MKHRLGLTPGTPRFIAMRVIDAEDKLPAKEHAIYQSWVSTLLYLTKHSRPDLCNAVRELSKTMGRPAPIHLNKMSDIYWKQEDMDSSFTQEEVHCLFKPSVTVIFWRQGNKNKCLWILCVFLWISNCMEK